MEPLRSRAALALERGTAPFFLVAPSLAPDAFTPDGLLRTVHAVALRSAGAVRMLLGTIPNPSSSSEAALAGGVLDLLRAGAEVRVAKAAPSLQEPPRLLYTLNGTKRALGAVQRRDDAWVATDTSFGARWGLGYVTVEQRGTTAEAAFDAFTKAWETSTPVTAEALVPKPSSGVHYVPVREGATEPWATSLPMLLKDKIASPSELGAVTRLVYVDRYVARSGIAVWNLFRTLDAFRYAKSAKIALRCLTPTGSGKRTLEAILDRYPRDPLSRGEMEAFADDLRGRKGIRPSFEYALETSAGGSYLRHGRVLLVDFEKGSKLRSLRIDLDMGMDWLFAASPRNWSRARMSAKATYFVLIENFDLSQEKEVQ
jgi:hypothetical protein